MTSTTHADNEDFSEIEMKQASNAAMASLLNLTFLPLISFIWLLIKNRETRQADIYKSHLRFGIKLNLIAGFALLVVSALMIAYGGFYSAWTWVYVITYFTLVHSVFIVIAVWALTKAWAGKPPGS